MVKFFARARLAAAVLGLVAAVGCSAADVTTASDQLEKSSTGSVELRLRNAGSATLTNISVLVAENAPLITSKELRAGQTTAYVARAKAHENPLVTLKADGHDYMSHPIEGFAGFNPALADGRYTISMEPVVVEGFKALYVKVTKDK